MQKPTLLREILLWKENFLVAGLDEVGRGSFAGPLLFSAVILKPSSNKNYINYWQKLGIKDSKSLSAQKREGFAKVIQKEAFSYDFEAIEVPTINTLGLSLAMKKAVDNLTKKVLKKAAARKIFFLTDAFSIDSVPKNIQQSIICGDQISLTIAAASIIAKVKRDRFMKNVAKNYPLYYFDKNKGYGTLKHRNALLKFGKCDLHRDQFIKNFIKN